jgi:hypothetical protein
MRSEIGGSASARIRGPGAAALLTTTIAALCLLGLAPRPASGRSVAIVGNHFVDGQRVIRLIGVDRSGSEHACSGPLTGGGFGYGILAGPVDDRAIAAMQSWTVSAVMLGLNAASSVSQSGCLARLCRSGR